MKNRTKGLIIDLCALVLWGIAFASLSLYAYCSLNADLIVTVVFSLIGLIVDYILCVAFHEAGHLIFAKKSGMRLVKVNFGVFTVDYRNDKKIKWFTLFKKNAGESEFLPTKKFDEQTVKSVAFGGLLFNAIFLLGVFCVILFVKNPIVFCLFGVGGATVGYLFFINALPFDKTSDGAIVFSKNGYARAIATIGETQRQIMLGNTPKYEDYVFTSDEPLEIYCDYLRLAQNDAALALKRLSTLKNDYDLTPQEYGLIFPEILFNACISGLLTDELIARAENFYSEETVLPSEIRAHYVYRVVRGDDEWANVLLDEYEKKISAMPSAYKNAENNLFGLAEKHLKGKNL